MGKVACDYERQFFGIISNPMMDNLYNEGFWSIEHDGSNPLRISDDFPIYINTLDDYLYYIQQKDSWEFSGPIIRIKKDGTNRKIIYEKDCNSMIAIGSWLFFIDNIDKNIYKISADGNSITKITGDNCVNLQYSDGWLYYIAVDNQKEVNTLCKINIENCKESLQLTNIGWDFILHDNWIYYTLLKPNSQLLYRMKEDGSENQLLYDRSPDDYAVYDNSVLMNVDNEQHYEILCSMDLDGKNEKLLLDDPQAKPEGIAGTAGQYIYYYYDLGEWMELARLKEDGTDNKALRDILGDTDFSNP